MIVQVGPVKLDGQHWVNVTIDGTAMEPRGPFPNADAAEAVARQLRRFSRALSGGKHG